MPSFKIPTHFIKYCASGDKFEIIILISILSAYTMLNFIEISLTFRKLQNYVLKKKLISNHCSNKLNYAFPTILCYFMWKTTSCHILFILCGYIIRTTVDLNGNNWGTHLVYEQWSL